MALPQKVIEQLGREPAQTPGWSGRLLMISSTVFFIALGVYLGITFGYKPYLQSQLDALNDRITKKSAAVSADEQTNILTFYAQLTNIRTLLDKRQLVSHFFNWLESNTQPNVAFKVLSLGGDKVREVKLSGVAKSVDDFVDQARQFESRPEVTKAVFTSLSLAEKVGWQFEVTLTFKDSVFTGAQSGSGAAVSEGSSTTP